MKTLLMLLAVLTFSVSASWAAGNGICQRDRDRDCIQDPAGCQCCDVDGDGICDKCGGTCEPKGEDADGDGIPNGQDPDYSPPQDGSGRP
jgi:hypothetical protein